MPRRRVPAYCHMKSCGQAYVRINEGSGRKTIYLGPYDSLESRRRYEQIVGELLAADETPLATGKVTVDELALRFLEYAKTHYRKAGKLTSEFECMRLALRPLIALYGPTLVATFGPRKLDDVRREMILKGYCRKSINKHIRRLRRVFKWGVSQEIVSPDVLVKMQSIDPLQVGRTVACERSPVAPVPIPDVLATMRELPSVTRSLILVQLYTGMRSGELLPLELSQLDRTAEVWRYAPATHKTQHHDKSRVVFIGRRAQRHIERFAADTKSGPVFRSSRGESYTVTGYRWVIRRACERAGVPIWNPHRLRHNAATMLRHKYGHEVARVVLGHSSVRTTEQYVLEDFRKAREAMAEVG